MVVRFAMARHPPESADMSENRVNDSSENSHKLPYARSSGRRPAIFNADTASYIFATLLLSGIWHFSVWCVNMSIVAVKFHQPDHEMPAIVELIDDSLAHTSYVFVSRVGCSIIWIVCGLCYIARRRGADLRASAVLAYGVAILLLLLLVSALGVIVSTIPMLHLHH